MFTWTSAGQDQDIYFPKVVHMNCYRTESGHESINFTDTENLHEISPKEDSLTCPEHRKCNFSSSEGHLIKGQKGPSQWCPLERGFAV